MSSGLLKASVARQKLTNPEEGGRRTQHSSASATSRWA